MKYVFLLLLLLSGCSHIMPAKAKHVSNGDKKVAKFSKLVAEEFKDNVEIQIAAHELSIHAEQYAGFAKESFMLLDMISALTGYDIVGMLAVLGLGGSTLHQGRKKNKAEKKLLAKLPPSEAERELA